MYCKYCGHKLNSDNVCTNPECPSNLNKHTDNDSTENINNTDEHNSNDNFSNGNETYTEFRDADGISISEMITFIGDKRTEYYLDTWTAFQNNPNFVSWNWGAFLFGFYWFWYRRMYAFTVLILTVSIFGTYFLPDGVGELLSLGISIGCGLFGNQLYMKSARERILSAKSLSSKGIDYNIIMKRISIKGGTTITPLIASAVLFAFLILIVVLILLLNPSVLDSSTILY